MPLLRAKLTCFYCNGRSSQAKTAGLRRWHCTRCDADNWLDEKGEVTDPPTTPSTPTTTTTAPPPPPPSQSEEERSGGGDPLFCATCIKNQHLYTTSLSNFYPDAKADGQAGIGERDYERAEAAYRASLEERYPLICEACEPRVRERLKRVNYDAKADHLGRVMDRLRGGKGGRSSLGWKGWVVRIGGAMWAIGWAAQVASHLMGLMNMADEGESDGLVQEQESGWMQCADSARATGRMSPACFDRVSTELVPIVLWMGLLAAWWHPRLQEKLDRSFGHVVGLADYYRLQVVSMGARWGCWYWVTHQSPVEPRTYHAVHLFMTLFSLLVVLSSYRCVSMDYTPRVSFAESPEPLVRRKVANDAQASSSTEVSSTNSTESSSHGRKPYTKPPAKFSINDLAPLPRAVKQPTRLPTPPPEPYDDDAAMDWTPSITDSLSLSRPSRPAANNILNPPQPQQPSPFHGTLPSNIHPPSHRLRNPQTALPFFPLKPNNSRAGAKTSALDMSGLGPSLFGSDERARATQNHYPLSPSEEDGESSGPSRMSSVFADQRFFPTSTHTADTGLEDMLARRFRLDETPVEVTTAAASSSPLPHPSSSSSSSALAVRKSETRRRPRRRGQAWIWSLVLTLVSAAVAALLVIHSSSSSRDAADVAMGGWGDWVDQRFQGGSGGFWRWSLDV